MWKHGIWHIWLRFWCSGFALWGSMRMIDPYSTRIHVEEANLLACRSCATFLTIREANCFPARSGCQQFLPTKRTRPWTWSSKRWCAGSLGKVGPMDPMLNKTRWAKVAEVENFRRGMVSMFPCYPWIAFYSPSTSMRVSLISNHCNLE